jgi:hypothetical protein
VHILYMYLLCCFVWTAFSADYHIADLITNTDSNHRHTSQPRRRRPRIVSRKLIEQLQNTTITCQEYRTFDTKYNILILSKESRTMVWLPAQRPSVTNTGLSETPGYHATHGKHHVQRLYRLRYAMKLTVFSIRKDAKHKRRAAFAAK